MKIVFITIVLDGLPWIASHYWEWQKLTSPWEWRIIEGVAAPVNCTSWVRQMPPRLSSDGTTQVLDSLAAFDPRVILFRKSLWPGKTAMLNEALKSVDEPCLLIQVDHDERWTAEQITKLAEMFEKHQEKNSARFRSRYFVGHDIVIANTDQNHFGNMPYEWNRAWRFTPGTVFESHEPPRLQNYVERPFTHAETMAEGLVFDHFAYCTEAQVAFKANLYGSSNNAKGNLYEGAVENWRRLQANRKWPVMNLAEYLPFVGPGVIANKI